MTSTRTPRLLGQKQNKFLLTVCLCALTAALIFLPFYLLDGGFFHYAGDFNSQQISFYRYMNGFIKGLSYPDGAGSVRSTFSWATDLGSGAMNAYSFYLYGSPFFWFSLLFPQQWLPYLMVPLLVLKFAAAGGGAYLYLRRYVQNQNYAVLGAALGFVILWPAVLSLLQNPRTIDLSSGWGFLTYSKPQQYLAILLSWILPPDSPYMTSIWSEGIIKWTSMTAYLPLCSLAGAVAYWQTRQGDSKKRIVGTCAVFALVPVLNSGFYALNSSYYARWFYMPVLILAAMTVNALEDPAVELDRPAKRIGWLMIATLAFALVPVQDTSTKEWTLGVLQNPGQYAAVLGFGLAGLLVYRFITRRWRQDKRLPQRMLAAVLAFSCLFGITHIGIGKFGQWNTDSDLVEEYTNALALKEDLPEGDWRIDTFKTHDNLGLWLDKSSLQYFGSTAAPSILSFYPALGVKRDVRSQPELENYALRGLLSVKYLITTPAHQSDFLAVADDGWSYYDTLDGFTLYENDNYVPMGFTYDYYLTEDAYESTITVTRSNLLMRALVLSEEDAAAYGQYLTELPAAELNDLTYDRYVQDCADRRASACSVFQMTNSGFHAEITLDTANLVFFSVPYDDGFTATVNGREADILRVDEGLMAVLCPAGESTIDFVYQPAGIRLSKAVTRTALVVFAAYTVYFVWDDRKKRKH